MPISKLLIKKNLYRVEYTPKHATLPDEKLIVSENFQTLTVYMAGISCPKFAAEKLTEVLA